MLIYYYEKTLLNFNFLKICSPGMLFTNTQIHHSWFQTNPERNEPVDFPNQTPIGFDNEVLITSILHRPALKVRPKTYNRKHGILGWSMISTCTKWNCSAGEATNSRKEGTR